ncbi:hypothetical protein BFS14_14805 [Serratia fonticola]|uniref:hypothetical protein n=1 Tax=Serratia fonticola TaxID=47917 RepID=UPI0008FD0185|nr:hypothetical protein [Serratia fonticola]MBC3252296.1 hypothetical protein [Serratia fonticola]OIX95626.1 hypothetical protein BFS14_14805 [Serratia fonticola]QCR62139.1 hypothetical protein FD644_18090 [Serratia fonticola]
MKKKILVLSFIMFSASSMAATGVWHDSGSTEAEAEFAEATSVKLELNHTAHLTTDKVGRDEALATLTATSKTPGLIGFQWKIPVTDKENATLLTNTNDGSSVEVEFSDQSNRALMPSTQDNHWYVTQDATNTSTKIIVQIRPTVDDQAVTPGSYNGMLQAARYVE